MLSVIIPSFNEEDNIQNTAVAIKNVLDGGKIDFEIIFADDGSRDSTWEKIKKEHERDKRVNGLRLSRNFGKESAILSGLKAAGGDCVAVIDCDLQHPPEALLEMYKLWANGAEVVEGKKSSRGRENGVYKGLSGLFYRLIQSASGIDMADTSDFKLLDRKAVNAIISMPERSPFFRALSGWVGFKSETVYYDVRERAFGEKKWSAGMLIKYAVRNLMSFTGFPLWLSAAAGILTVAASLVLMILSLAGVHLGSFNMGVIVLMLIGGMILLSTAAAGYYIYRIYGETQRRPRFIVSDTTLDNDFNFYDGE